MIGVVVDLVLGTLIVAAVMVAFHRQHRYDPVPLVIDDELLHRVTVGLRRLEQSAQSVGVASAQAAKAFKRFGIAYEEFARRQYFRD